MGRHLLITVDCTLLWRGSNCSIGNGGNVKITVAILFFNGVVNVKFVWKACVPLDLLGHQ